MAQDHFDNDSTMTDTEENDELLEFVGGVVVVGAVRMETLPDEIIFEIVSFLGDPKFLMRNGLMVNLSLISKRWFDGIQQYAKLCLTFRKRNLSSESLGRLLNSEFLNCFTEVDADWVFNNETASLKDQFIFFNALSYMRNVTKLNIGNNGIDSKFIETVCTLPKLTNLSIQNNGIDMRGVNLISQMNQLTVLNISRNDIRDYGAELISKMSGLTELNISNNNIGDHGASFISKMDKLTSLDISNNSVGLFGAKSISTMTQLTKLNIRYCLIGEKGAKLINSMKLSSNSFLMRNAY